MKSSLSREREDIKKNQMAILELKNTILIGLNNRMEGTKERISELKDKIEITQFYKKKKKTWTDLFVSLESQKREGRVEKSTWRNNGYTPTRMTQKQSSNANCW